jgi:AsmA protein
LLWRAPLGSFPQEVVMKKVLIVVGIVIVVLILIVVALPFVVDANRFKPTLETDLTTALGRKVEIGNIGLSILSGGVTVDSVVIADDPAFSRAPFLQAKQLTAGVALIPLIFSKKLEVSSFTVTDPQVSLLRSSSGTWNFSSLGAGGAKKTESQSQPGASPSAADSAGQTDISVAKLKISNGTIVVGTAGTHGKTQTYKSVEFEASDLSYSSQFPFTFTAKTPGGGTVKVEGKAGPINATDASLTPLDAKLDVSDLDLASTGFVDPSTGVAGIVDFNGTLASNGRQMTSKGTVKANKIKIVAAGSPSSVPVNVNYATTYELKSQTGTLTQGDVHIGQALAHLTGAYDTAGTQTVIRMKLNGQGMPVADLEGVLPAAGVKLPSGASLKSGSMDVNLALNGPVDKLVITGPVNLSNGVLAGYNLKSKLGALSSFAGLGGNSGGSNTDIQKLSADVHVDSSGTQANNVDLIVPSIGTVTGNAAVSPENKLSGKMVAKLSAGSVAGVMGTALSSFTGGGSSKGGGGIPFTLSGTTSTPIFLPDLTGMAKGMAGTATGAPTSAAGAASGIIGGLFGKKKK